MKQQRQNNRYKFYLESQNYSRVECHPVFSSLKKTLKLDGEEMYYRSGLDGEISFIDTDFDFVLDQSVYTRIMFYIYKDKQLYFTGHFYKKDCQTDCNHRIVKVKITTEDNYGKLLGKADDEYNLAALNTVKDKVNLRIDPMAQIYGEGEQVVCNIIERHTNVTMECSPMVVDGTSLWGADFGVGVYVKIYDSNNHSVMEGHMQPTDQAYLKDDSVMLIPTKTSNGNGTYSYGAPYMAFVRKSDTTWDIDYWSGNSNSNQRTNLFPNLASNSFGDMAKYLNNFGVVNGRFTFRMIPYAIRLFDYANGLSNNTWTAKNLLFPSEAYNRVQTLRLGYGSPGGAIATYYQLFTIGTCIWLDTDKMWQVIPNVSERVTTTETEWGSYVDNGTTYYYLPPDNTYPYVPFARSYWNEKGVSWWWDLRIIEYMYQQQVNANENPYITKGDWCRIGVVLKALLNEIDPTIQFDETPDYSHFFYDATNPIDNTHNSNPTYLMTAKSNVISGNYDYPAWKAPITLNNFLNMLRNVFNCYWYIDNDKKFHIEHIKWFLNGRSYTTPDYSGKINLNKLIDPRNGKPYAYRTNNWEYDGGETPTRIEFSWMDTSTTDLFDGSPIIPYMTMSEDNKEVRQVERFTSAFTFLQSVGTLKASQDGFSIIEAFFDNNLGAYQITVCPDPTPNWGNYTINNGYMSFYWLHERFFAYNIPCDKAYINGVLHNIQYLKNLRFNTVFVPAMIGDPNCNQWGEPDEYPLVSTEVGQGVAEEIETDLSSDRITLKVKYNNEN